MFVLNFVNKPAVTMTVTKIIYFAQSQKEASEGEEKKKKKKKPLSAFLNIICRTMETFTENS